MTVNYKDCKFIKMELESKDIKRIYTKQFANQLRKAVVDKLILASDVFANSKYNMIEARYGEKLIRHCYAINTFNRIDSHLKEKFIEFINITKDDDINNHHEIIKMFVDDILTELSEYKPKLFYKLSLEEPFNCVTTDKICRYPIRITIGCGLNPCYPIIGICIGII